MTEKNEPKLIKPTTTPINIGSVTLSKVLLNSDLYPRTL